MNRNLLSIQNAKSHRYLNIGCGRRYHRDWVNLDLDSSDPDVIRHDVTAGVPFESAEFDVVYHSHILEHLKPEQGEELIAECFRVLKPGGVLRVVVPDLERIARLYLETHQRAWAGDADSEFDYNWMKLELLDQMVREDSGGRMGRYMTSQELKNSDFVRSRVGDELSICQSCESSPAHESSWPSRLVNSTLKLRTRVVKCLVRWMLGREAERALNVGLFRNQGEVHLWMYDKFSLRQLCRTAGFVNFRVCAASESRIENYSQFQLDTVDGQIRKPDSVFVECEKPALAAAKKIAA
jgi:predicted SAM-dependent methyltransferase